LIFNILIGNTDDHARNHAAFWDGENLAFTPAFDICPQSRAGGDGWTTNIGGGGSVGFLNSTTLFNGGWVCSRNYRLTCICW
jgi:serine/threonine protein kinase HipA of HipAB toxin-antitoxin module